MLSISDFSEMCRLSAQALRFYHAEGLLVPAQVDERTGYRSYDFEQVEQAMLVSVLRATGMSVKEVRRCLDSPEEAAALLNRHVDGLRRERRSQDEAIGDAEALLADPPEPRLRSVPEMTVASAEVPGVDAGDPHYDWIETEGGIGDAVRRITAALEACGAAVAGTAWRTQALETPEQRSGLGTREGPHWLVKVPFTAGGDTDLTALPADIEVQDFAARTELSVFLPGRSSMAKFATALSRLAAHPLDEAITDISRTRQVLHPTGMETAAAVIALEDVRLDSDDEGMEPDGAP